MSGLLTMFACLLDGVETELPAGLLADVRSTFHSCMLVQRALQPEQASPRALA